MSGPRTLSRSLGIEEELLLFTRRGDRPATKGEDLHDDASTDVEHELKLEQAEIATPPGTDLAAIGADLVAARRELVAAAAEHGVTVAALATSPLAHTPTATPDERYERMRRRYRAVVEDQLTCGMHVHVGVGSRAEGVRALDGVRHWLPVLVALTANSPYWQGADSGYASFRTLAWGRWPTAGPTDPFGSEQAYDDRVATLIASGASVDEGMIYFDARLSATYPTVEFRMADVCQRPDGALLTAALARAMVSTAVSADAPPDVDVALLRAATWRAARFGLAEDLFDPVERRVLPAADLVDRLVADVEPALRETGDLDLVHDAVGRLLRDGTGADLQRADAEAADGDTAAVVRRASERMLPDA